MSYIILIIRGLTQSCKKIVVLSRRTEKVVTPTLFKSKNLNCKPVFLLVPHQEIFAFHNMFLTIELDMKTNKNNFN